METDDACSRADQLEWVKFMRRKFSPQEMLNADGQINQEFFKPTQVIDVLVSA